MASQTLRVVVRAFASQMEGHRFDPHHGKLVELYWYCDQDLVCIKGCGKYRTPGLFHLSDLDKDLISNDRL